MHAARSSRPSVDFNYVEPKHADIHRRLENWSRWCRSGTGSGASPMFRLYQSEEHWEGEQAGIPVDSLDASRIAKGVAALPSPHRLSLSWCYITASNPRKACQTLGTSMEGLALYVRDGRQMLLNRRV